MIGNVRRAFRRAVWLATLAPAVAAACPFCLPARETMASRILEADVAVIARPVDPQEGRARIWRIEVPVHGPGAEFADGTGRIEFSRPVVVGGDGSDRRLLYCRINRATSKEKSPFGKLRVERASPAPDDATLHYVRGAMAARASTDPGRWKHFIDHLFDPNAEIATDAFHELTLARYADLLGVKPHLLPERIKTAILEPSTPGDRVGVLGLLVGIAGRSSDAGFLLRQIDHGDARVALGVDGLLGGLFLLDAVKGTERSLELLLRIPTPNDPTGRIEANRRAALRALEFALAENAISDRKATLERMRPAIGPGSVGERTLDLQRNYRNWSCLAEALRLLAEDRKSQGQDAPPRPAVVRFLMACPLNEAKTAFAELAAKHPQAVEDAKQALRLERDAMGQR